MLTTTNLLPLLPLPLLLLLLSPSLLQAKESGQEAVDKGKEKMKQGYDTTTAKGQEVSGGSSGKRRRRRSWSEHPNHHRRHLDMM